jgi:hypothetical protein
MAATSGMQWADWRPIHVESGPFVNEVLGDFYRWKQENVLSILVQELPQQVHQATRLRVIDFRFE